MNVPRRENSMQTRKEHKLKAQIIFSVLISVVVLIADFYAIINFSKEYILISAITVILLLCLWSVVNGLFSLRDIKEAHRDEQYDSIFKSEKASYLLLKKYFDEIEEKIDILKVSSKIPTEEIINAQKGIAKVVINRNRENADATMGSNEQLFDRIQTFEEKLKESNELIIETQKNILLENINDISVKQQELFESIKEMEIRINQTITTNPIQFTANVGIPNQAEYVLHERTVEEPIVDDISLMMPKGGITDTLGADSTETEIDNEDIEAETEQPVVSESVLEESQEDEKAESLDVDEGAAEAESDNGINDIQQEEYTESAESMTEEQQETAENTVSEQQEKHVEAPVDLNRQLSPDEIAALFADSQSAKKEEKKNEEQSKEAKKKEAKSEEAKLEEPEDLNRQLSPDEIAALFAKAQGNEEPAPEPEKKEQEPEPNRNLTPDEIAALIGNL